MGTDRILEFASTHAGRPSRISIKSDSVKTIIETDEGASIITSDDAYHVTASYDECRAAIWPEIEP